MASAAAPKRVVIVESPTKATTIARFLDDTYTVESSRGHVRDLPTKASEIPKTFRSEPWARLGIDVENDFKPLYVLNSGKRDTVSSLKKLVATADELYLATDEDREGEAIAWHLLEVLSPPQRVTIRRLVFHEITPDAIRAALANPREIDRRLVDAQEARRLLDRLYGYEVSPVLWKKVAPRLSAGRVQSVATRIVVERERQRMAFVPAGYWSLLVTAATRADEHFGMAATALDGARLASGPGLRSRWEAKHRRCRRPRRGQGPAARRGVGGRDSRGDLRGVQAVPPSPRGAVHYLHPAAGGGAAPCACQLPRSCAWLSRSTSRASSPTCAPTR